MLVKLWPIMYIIIEWSMYDESTKHFEVSLVKERIKSNRIGLSTDEDNAINVKISKSCWP